MSKTNHPVFVLICPMTERTEWTAGRKLQVDAREVIFVATPTSPGPLSTSEPTIFIYGFTSSARRMRPSFRLSLPRRGTVSKTSTTPWALTGVVVGARAPSVLMERNRRPLSKSTNTVAGQSSCQRRTCRRGTMSSRWRIAST